MTAAATSPTHKHTHTQHKRNRRPKQRVNVQPQIRVCEGRDCSEAPTFRQTSLVVVAFAVKRLAVNNVDKIETAKKKTKKEKKNTTGRLNCKMIDFTTPCT